VGTTTTGRLLRANPPSTAPRLPLPLPRRRVPRSSSVPSPVRASSGTRYAPTPPSPRALLPRGRGHEHEHDWASAVWSGASGQTPLHRPAPPSPSPAATCAQVFFGSFASASIITSSGTRYAPTRLFFLPCCAIPSTQIPKRCTGIWSGYNGMHVLCLCLTAY
jgi:hypothetical protein